MAHPFRWQAGRQGTGYDKMLLLTARWPLPFDSYLIRYPEGAEIPPHTDPVKHGRHYRLNIVVKASPSGGEFVCAAPLFASRRIKLFRPTPASTASPAWSAAAATCCRSAGCWAHARSEGRVAALRQCAGHLQAV